MGFAARGIPKRDRMSESDPFLMVRWWMAHCIGLDSTRLADQWMAGAAERGGGRRMGGASGCACDAPTQCKCPAHHGAARSGWPVAQRCRRSPARRPAACLQCWKLRRVPGGAAEDWIPVFKTEVRAAARVACPATQPFEWWTRTGAGLHPCNAVAPLGLPCTCRRRAAGCPPAGATAAAPACPAPQVRDNNTDPIWRPIEVDIRQLCSGDEDRPLKLQARLGRGARRLCR